MLTSVLISLAVVSALVLLVLLVALVRNLRAMSGAIHRLQADLIPVLEEIQANAQRTRERLDRIARTEERPPG
ncbi:MAG: hypothetical protein ACRDI0_01560 [Actinomycetota bacterium]